MTDLLGYFSITSRGRFEAGEIRNLAYFTVWERILQDSKETSGHCINCRTASSASGRSDHLPRITYAHRRSFL